MSTKYNNGVVRNFLKLLHENSTTAAKIINDKPVVHHFMTHINRTAEYLQCTIYNINGTIDAGTKTTGISQQHVHLYRLLIARRGVQCSSATSTLWMATRKDKVRPASG